MTRDEEFMTEAIREAEMAAKDGDVPVGAVLVADDRVIARAHNEKEARQLATAHAEILCLERGCNDKNNWRLSDCTLYVTMEPCPMCAGALWSSRIGRIVYGVKDPVAGACGTVWSFADSPLHWKPETTSGVCAEECRALLTEFFKNRRQKAKE